MTGDKKQLGKILLQQRAVSAEELDAASGGAGRIGSKLSGQGTLDPVAALKALSEQQGVPGIDLTQVCLKLEDLELLPREIAERHLILPVLVRDDRLFVAMANPRERKVIDELEFVTGKRVYPYVALQTPLLEVIEAAYTRRSRGERFFVGARCPEAVLARYGIDADGVPVQEDADFGGALSGHPLSLDTEPPARVLDDALARAGAADDVDSELGELSSEVSVVDLLQPIELAESTQSGPTVLVVDDEADIRKMLKRLLEARGYRVLEAERGQTALALVKEQTPDLIVLDAMLPEIHGFDIARRIKQSQRYGHIPIVMVSAVYRGWRYAEDLKASYGVDAFIEKPFRIQDVVRAVEGLLSGAGAEPASDPERESTDDVEQALAAGVAAYKAGNVDEAVAHLERGISIDPLAYRLRLHLGLLHGKQGRIYEAIAELERAVEINGRHFPALKNLAVLYQKAGFRNKASETWERALRLAPDEPTQQSIREHILQLL